jgi:hypothetical protein
MRNLHDPELPRGFQDADLEMAELTASAKRETRLRRAGICAHGWLQGPPGPDHKPTSVVTCLDCGAVFASEADAHEARREALE